MEMPTLGHRIRAARKKMGETQEDFAKRFGVDQSTISKWEGGKQIPESYHLDIVADLEGEDSSDSDNRMFTMTPLIGSVGAGARVYLFQHDTTTSAQEHIKAPKGFGAVEALRIAGDSMYPAYKDGDVVYITQRHAEFPLERGSDYVVHLEDGRILLKMVEPGDDGTYDLISHNAPPERNVLILQAHKVRYVRKK